MLLPLLSLLLCAAPVAVAAAPASPRDIFAAVLSPSSVLHHHARLTTLLASSSTFAPSSRALAEVPWYAGAECVDNDAYLAAYNTQDFTSCTDVTTEVCTWDAFFPEACPLACGCPERECVDNNIELTEFGPITVDYTFDGEETGCFSDVDVSFCEPDFEFNPEFGFVGGGDWVRYHCPVFCGVCSDSEPPSTPPPTEVPSTPPPTEAPDAAWYEGAECVDNDAYFELIWGGPGMGDTSCADDMESWMCTNDYEGFREACASWCDCPERECVDNNDRVFDESGGALEGCDVEGALGYCGADLVLGASFPGWFRLNCPVTCGVCVPDNEPPVSEPPVSEPPVSEPLSEDSSLGCSDEIIDQYTIPNNAACLVQFQSIYECFGTAISDFEAIDVTTAIQTEFQCPTSDCLPPLEDRFGDCWGEIIFADDEIEAAPGMALGTDVLSYSVLADALREYPGCIDEFNDMAIWEVHPADSCFQSVDIMLAGLIGVGPCSMDWSLLEDMSDMATPLEIMSGIDTMRSSQCDNTCTAAILRTHECSPDELAMVTFAFADSGESENMDFFQSDVCPIEETTWNDANFGMFFLEYMFFYNCLPAIETCSQAIDAVVGEVFLGIFDTAIAGGDLESLDESITLCTPRAYNSLRSIQCYCEEGDSMADSLFGTMMRDAGFNEVTFSTGAFLEIVEGMELCNEYADNLMEPVDPDMCEEFRAFNALGDWPELENILESPASCRAMAPAVLAVAIMAGLF